MRRQEVWESTHFSDIDTIPLRLLIVVITCRYGEEEGRVERWQQFYISWCCAQPCHTSAVDWSFLLCCSLHFKPLTEVRWGQPCKWASSNSSWFFERGNFSFMFSMKSRFHLSWFCCVHTSGSEILNILHGFMFLSCVYKDFTHWQFKSFFFNFSHVQIQETLKTKMVSKEERLSLPQHQI